MLLMGVDDEASIRCVIGRLGLDGGATYWWGRGACA